MAIATVRDEVRDSGYANLSNMIAIAEAERAREPGVQDAIELLKPELRGTELYLTHAALRDAYAATGRDADALDESNWLAGHRGRNMRNTMTIRRCDRSKRRIRFGFA